MDPAHTTSQQARRESPRKRADARRNHETALMNEAKAAGRVRPDASPLDLRVVLCGMCLQLIRLEERDPALWRRYGELTLRALRP
ncbi:SbtR family transcriptional regulator [Streptomyces chartreusis]|uniref:SbtR family transcriptional regulator n=1 Tax=Streptomyces chartreusis TaxID=1969 RepID=UPI003653F719